MEICIEYDCSRQWVELPATIDDIIVKFKREGIEVMADFEDEFLIVDTDTELDYPLGYYDLDDLNSLAEEEF